MRYSFPDLTVWTDGRAADGSQVWRVESEDGDVVFVQAPRATDPGVLRELALEALADNGC